MKRISIVMLALTMAIGLSGCKLIDKIKNDGGEEIETEEMDDDKGNDIKEEDVEDFDLAKLKELNSDVTKANDSISAASEIENELEDSVKNIE